jgi:hypothetical protein
MQCNEEQEGAAEVADLIRSDNKTPFRVFCCLAPTLIQRIIHFPEPYAGFTFEKDPIFATVESTQPPRTLTILIAAADDCLLTSQTQVAFFTARKILQPGLPA